jgi:hypothetical protein
MSIAIFAGDNVMTPIAHANSVLLSIRTAARRVA